MKVEIYANQIPQLSAMNNGTFNIHLKGWKFADSIEDLLFGNVETNCGTMEVEVTKNLCSADTHLMNVLSNKSISLGKTVDGLVFPIKNFITNEQ